MLYRLTDPSKALKLTGCAVVTSERRTCPSTCPLKGAGCYGENHPTRYHWTPGPTWSTLDDLCAALRALPPLTPTRYAMIGDLPGHGTRIARRQLEQLDDACAHLTAWTYTHKPVTGPSATAAHNRAAIAACRHLVVNLSANNPWDAIRLRALDIAPVVCVTAHDTADRQTYFVEAGGRQARFRTCYHATHGIDCRACLLCAQRDRGAVVAFPAHGARWKAAERATFNA